MAEIGRDIILAKQLLEAGQLVGIPTETVYGLAGNAFSEKAVAEIFSVKDRPNFDPLIVHTYNFEKITDWASNIPIAAFRLAEKFMPGPITLLLNKKSIIPDLVTAGMDSVAVRVPNHPLTLELLKQLAFPLAAPSANPFGYISPTTAGHVNDQLGTKIPYILDGGGAKIGIESTIVGFENEDVIVYRLGGLSIEELEEVVGKIKIVKHSSSNPQAPGMLKSHYAPSKKLSIQNLNGLLEKYPANEIGVLAFNKFVESLPLNNQIILSPNANFSEAASNLFSSLRQLEKFNIKIIYAELLPEIGLGRAINDRLRRAAA